MSKSTHVSAAIITTIGLSVMASHVALATDGNVGQVEDFIRNIIKIVAGLSGLIATAYFVVGGLGYITSSGDPEKLFKSKQTLLWAAIGLSIVISAFVISNIVVGLATNSFGK